MPREIVHLRTELRRIEAAAQILAWIVYPDSATKRRRYADAIVLTAPTQAARHDPRWNSVEIPVRVSTLAGDSSSALNVTKRASIILTQRIQAGNMALPLIATGIGFDVRSPDGLSLNSLNKVASETAGLTGGEEGGDDRNIKTRIWGPSRPVLHLCAAFVVLIIRYKETRWGGNLFGLLEDRDAILELVEIAEIFRTFILEWHPPMPTVYETEQIQILLVS